MLARAMQAFLFDGFEAASYEKIAQEMGLSKPSLYNSFGDKLSLFQRVLDAYAMKARSQIADSLSNHTSIEDAVRHLLRSAANFYSRQNGPSLGCLLVGTALPASTQHERIRKTLSSFLNSLDLLLEEIIEAQYGAESLARGQSPRALALQISSLVHTLAIRARMGLTRTQLTECADELASTVANRD